MQKPLEQINSTSDTLKLKKSSFAGDVMKLVTGTTIAQGMIVLASPFLARLYSPEDFGVLALFISITSILGVIACLRYELAIMLPESDAEAVNLLAVSIGFTFITATITGIVVWLWGAMFLEWLNAPTMAPYLWLLPITVLIEGLFHALNYWNSRTKHFGRLSIARVTSSTTALSTQLGAGYAGFATGGSLIGGRVAGQAIATTVLGGQIWRDDRQVFWKSIRWRDMVTGGSRYRKFPLISTWSALMNVLSSQLPIFLITLFFSSTIVGYYAFGYRILTLPMSLIGSSIAQVFFQRASVSKSNGTLSLLVEETFNRLIKLGLFPILLLSIIGSDVYIVVFGLEWSEAGVFTQILSIWVFFQFMSSPMASVVNLFNKLELAFVIQVFLVVTRFISLFIGGIYQDVRLGLLLYSISGVFIYAYLFYWIFSITGASISKCAYIIAKELLIFIPTGLLILLLKLNITGSFVVVVVSCIFLIIYYMYTYSIVNIFFSEK